MAHTPGPWLFEPPDDYRPSRVGVSADNHWVKIYDAPLTNETEANARLIAAAPDLLAVLVDLTNAADDEHFSATDPLRPIINQARAVIARATGPSGG